MLIENLAIESHKRYMLLNLFLLPLSSHFFLGPPSRPNSLRDHLLWSRLSSPFPALTELWLCCNCDPRCEDRSMGECHGATCDSSLPLGWDHSAHKTQTSDSKEINQWLLPSLPAAVSNREQHRSSSSQPNQSSRVFETSNSHHSIKRDRTSWSRALSCWRGQ